MKLSKRAQRDDLFERFVCDMKFTTYMLVVLAVVLAFVIFSIMAALVEKSRRETTPPFIDKMKSLHTALANLQHEIDVIHHQTVQQDQTVQQVATSNSELASRPSKLKPMPNEHRISHESAHISVHKALKRAVIFTMDSIGSYERNSLSGGAAGNA